MKKVINFIKEEWIFIIILLAVFAAGGFLRFWQLDTLPPGLQYDEAYNGTDAVKALENGKFELFYPDNNGREGLYINVIAVFFNTFGISMATLRAVSAIFGLFALFGFALLIKELKLSRLSMLLGTFMMSFSFWAINFSRTAYRGIMVPFLIVWIFYFFYLGLQKKNGWFIALAGLLTGFGFHTYISFRVVPLIFIIVVLGGIIFEKGYIKTYWKKALIFIFATVITLAPILIYFYQHQGDLIGRSNAVSVFNSPDASFPAALGKSLAYHIGAFFVHGDPSQRHNQGALPLLPATWSILFGLGLIISIKEIIENIIQRIKKKKKYKPSRLLQVSIFAQACFWTMLIPGVLSIEGIPHALRIIGAIPAVFLITVLPFEYAINLYEKIRKSKNLKLKPWRWNVLRGSVIGLVILVLISGGLQAYLYFGVWAKDTKTLDSFERKLYDLGLTIKQQEPKENNFIVIPEKYLSFNVYISPDHKDSSFKTTELVAYPEYKSFFFWYPLDAIKHSTCEKALYVFEEADEWLIESFKIKCPELEAQKIKPEGGIYNFWVLR
jgi:hypothetical protein